MSQTRISILYLRAGIVLEFMTMTRACLTLRHFCAPSGGHCSEIRRAQADGRRRVDRVSSLQAGVVLKSTSTSGCRPRQGGFYALQAGVVLKSPSPRPCRPSRSPSCLSFYALQAGVVLKSFRLFTPVDLRRCCLLRRIAVAGRLGCMIRVTEGLVMACELRKWVAQEVAFWGWSGGVRLRAGQGLAASGGGAPGGSTVAVRGAGGGGSSMRWLLNRTWAG